MLGRFTAVLWQMAGRKGVSYGAGGAAASLDFKPGAWFCIPGWKLEVSFCFILLHTLLVSHPEEEETTYCGPCKPARCRGGAF